MVEIRPERPEDFSGIRQVHELAFGQADEAHLVDALRAAGDHVPELCLVALAEGEIVGHILFSEARLDTGSAVLTLAPMGVRPARQRQGVGSALIREGLGRAAATDFPLVVVVGHADYYPRFGFEPGEDHGIVCPFRVPPESWMVHLLPAYRPEVRGKVEYPRAFGL
jgi:putative acetyltransferase